MKNMKYMTARIIAAALAVASAVLMSVGCNTTKEDPNNQNVTISVEPGGLGFGWNDSSEKSVVVKTTAALFEVSSSYSWIGARAEDGRVYVWMKSENENPKGRNGSVQVLALSKGGEVLAECSLAVSQEPYDGSSSGENDQFADMAFAEYVLEYFDYDQDGTISESEAESVKSMDIDSYGVKSIEGIAMFKNLEELDLSNNDIKTVDLRGLDRLQYLALQNCNTEYLLLEGCTGLTSIIARKNSLTDVNLSDQKAIQFLDLGQNLLTRFSISDRKDLQYVAVDMNSLTTMTINGCPKIKTLACHKNALEALDITSMPVLDWLDCSSNNIKSLDLSSGKSLISLMCDDNLLKSLDVNGCPSLKFFSCSSNRLEAIDVTPCKEIVKLDCGANPLTQLTINGCANLATLFCDDCSLPALDVTSFPALKSLACNGNSISTLDVASNTLLEMLHCQDNGMKTLYMAGGQTISDLKKDPDCEIIRK